MHNSSRDVIIQTHSTVTLLLILVSWLGVLCHVASQRADNAGVKRRAKPGGMDPRGPPSRNWHNGNLSPHLPPRIALFVSHAVKLLHSLPRQTLIWIDKSRKSRMPRLLFWLKLTNTARMVLNFYWNLSDSRVCFELLPVRWPSPSHRIRSFRYDVGLISSIRCSNAVISHSTLAARRRSSWG